MPGRAQQDVYPLEEFKSDMQKLTKMYTSMHKFMNRAKEACYETKKEVRSLKKTFGPPRGVPKLHLFLAITIVFLQLLVLYCVW